MVVSLIRELFINACILVTIVFLGSQLFLKTGVGSRSPLRVKVMAGLVGAFLGIVLMFFSIHIPPYSLIDLRNIALMIVAVYNGGIATFITGIVLALFRLLHLGVSYTSIIAAMTLLILTIAFALIAKLKTHRINKWIFMYLISGTMATLGFLLTIKDPEVLRHIIISYWAGTLFATLIAYSLTEYLDRIYLLLSRLTKESTVDFLTGLKNARSFNAVFNSVLDDALRDNEKVAILVLDIDFFKKVNDAYGHSAGDVVLQGLGGILNKSIRDFDIVARLGGEEFCVVLRNCSEPQVLEIAERIRRTVENHIFILDSETSLNITISIGCAIYPDTVADPDKLLGAADMKLYEAKRSGRNRVCI